MTGEGGEAAAQEDGGIDAFKTLRTDIIAGRLRAGSRLGFADLQAQYGIGTSPLREALSRLAADRLVIQVVNRGFSVPPLTLADFDDIAAMRLDLERKAIEASVLRGDEAWEEGLVLAHHRLRRLREQEAAPVEVTVTAEWELRHRAFHNALIVACGSPVTLHFCAILHDQFDRYRRFAGRDPVVQARLSRQHTEIMESAIAHDASGTGSILAEHIQATVSSVRERLQGMVPE